MTGDSKEADAIILGKDISDGFMDEPSWPYGLRRFFTLRRLIMTKRNLILIAVCFAVGLSLGGVAKAQAPKDVNVVNEPNVNVLNNVVFLEEKFQMKQNG